jgi:hypothetical protein
MPDEIDTLKIELFAAKAEIICLRLRLANAMLLLQKEMLEKETPPRVPRQKASLN